MALSGIGTQSISNLNRTSHRGPGAPAKESATDGYTGSAAVKLAGRPTFAKSSGHKSHLLTSKAVTMFVTAMTIGSLFIGMAQPAFAAPPAGAPRRHPGD